MDLEKNNLVQKGYAMKDENLNRFLGQSMCMCSS